MPRTTRLLVGCAILCIQFVWFFPLILETNMPVYVGFGMGFVAKYALDLIDALTELGAGR